MNFKNISIYTAIGIVLGLGVVKEAQPYSGKNESPQFNGSYPSSRYQLLKDSTCNDKNPCTDDMRDPQTGTCVWIANDEKSFAIFRISAGALRSGAASPINRS